MDIKNLSSLKKIVKRFKPDFIFHLAAQSLVSVSYQKPKETWETNLLGTLNVLEVLKNLKKTVAIIITSDKAYKNVEKKEGYKESIS